MSTQSCQIRVVKSIPPLPDYYNSGSMTELDFHVERFRDHLHLPDPGAVKVVMGTAVANILSGDPVWLLVIGPPGGGKTELICPLEGLKFCSPPLNVHFASTFSSEGAFLSGSPKGVLHGGTGGFLYQIGKFGFCIVKDFTSIIQMNRERRAEVLAALREIFDGSWNRHVGSEGGRELPWKGKMAFIAGCTEAIDEAHSVMATMGPRFILYRLPKTDARRQGLRAAQRGQGKDRQMRGALSDAVTDLFNGLPGGLLEACRDGEWEDNQFTPIPITGPEEERVVALAWLGARCRSAVNRNPYDRKVESVPEPEPPARLVLSLRQLLVAFRILKVSPEESWRILEKTALDSMPGARRKAFDCLPLAGELNTATIAKASRLPYSTAERALEDLKELEVLEQRSSKIIPNTPGVSNCNWKLSDWALEQLRVTRSWSELGVSVQAGGENVGGKSRNGGKK